jgi:histidine triad (HIT) family protein
VSTVEPSCIFCRIAAGQIPAKKVYEDNDIVVFHDIHPWAPVHILMVPKTHIVSMADITPEHAPLLGRMMALSPRLMRELGVSNGFRHVINSGHDGGQEVMHLHVHVMGGPRPWAKG